MQGYKKQNQKKKNQVNMIAPKEHKNFPVTDPKEIDIYELPDKECKIITSKLQENTDPSQFDETS